MSLSDKENIADVEGLYALFHGLDHCSIPVLILAHGHALGGAMGLLSVADYVIATADCRFSLSEVRLGLVPSIIGPFVRRALGPRWSRALFLTGKRFHADLAFRIGLVHELSPNLVAGERALATVLEDLLAGSPTAIRVAKGYIDALGSGDQAAQKRLAIETLATIRRSADAQEGMTAFLEKRRPSWHD